SIEEFNLKAKDLRIHFREKGYPNKCLKRAYKRALESDRSSLINEIIPTAPEDLNIIQLIATYDTDWSKVKESLQRFWPILTNHEHLKERLTPNAAIT
ncbi:Hypothetical predicted protein, partial [Pelobates cultripes]